VDRDLGLDDRLEVLVRVAKVALDRPLGEQFEGQVTDEAAGELVPSPAPPGLIIASSGA
jgi:hypothetical protein